MPCDQYELHLQNSVIGTNGNPDVAVASLDQSTSTATAVQLGHINVVLDHKSILLTITLQVLVQVQVTYLSNLQQLQKQLLTKII